MSRGRGVRGLSGRAPALPGRRPPPWRSPPGAPESPLSAEERRRDARGAEARGCGRQGPPASREPASGIWASFPSPPGSPSLSGPTQGSVETRFTGSLSSKSRVFSLAWDHQRIIWWYFQEPFRKASGSSLSPPRSPGPVRGEAEVPLPEGVCPGKPEWPSRRGRSTRSWHPRSQGWESGKPEPPPCLGPDWEKPGSLSARPARRAARPQPMPANPASDLGLSRQAADPATAPGAGWGTAQSSLLKGLRAARTAGHMRPGTVRPP